MDRQGAAAYIRGRRPVWTPFLPCLSLTIMRTAPHPLRIHSRGSRIEPGLAADADLDRARAVVEEQVSLLRAQIRGLIEHTKTLQRTLTTPDALKALSVFLRAGDVLATPEVLRRPKVRIPRAGLQALLEELLAPKSGRVADLVVRLDQRGVAASAAEVADALESAPERFERARSGRGWWQLRSKEAAPVE